MSVAVPQSIGAGAEILPPANDGDVLGKVFVKGE